MELLNFCQITIAPLDETTKDLNNCMLSRGNKSWSRKKKVRGNKIKSRGTKVQNSLLSLSYISI